ncbi:MAG: GTPase-activating protein [Verrucomicrobia bacterium]|nr:GTPase-activating protein [Deltaproteobacteria bacterium]
MFLLPKGKPLVENFPIAKLQLPEALDKLKNGKLTGCATFDFPSADCVLIYEDGKLISALLRRDKSELKDADALRALIDQMILADSGSFNVYGFSRDVNQAILALVRGDKIINQQELKQIDFKALLERIRNERMTATLKIFAEQRVGMIFYRDGANVGFFHDTAQTIGTTAGEVQQIAALPGATADLIALKGAEKLTLDLAGLVNIRSLWESARGGVFSTTEPVRTLPSQAVSAAQAPPPASSSADIESAIITIANSSLGKLGKTLVEKELMSVGGIRALKDETRLSEFLNALEKSSKLLASANKIREMRAAISSEVAKL